VARPTLGDAFTVICADLRGYGASGKPPSTPDHAPYSKAAMALFKRASGLACVRTGSYGIGGLARRIISVAGRF
jgi:pimeloyl-ACP methyl ester carboxylesterase